MLIVQQVSYRHPNKDYLFDKLSLTVNSREKIALIGNNGSGKSTLLKIIAGKLNPAEGQVTVDAKPYFVPQIFGQFNHLSIAEALQVDDKIKALKAILGGASNPTYFEALNDDWTIEERCKTALAHWQLDQFDLSEKMANLSGGQKTKVFLAGILIHQPQFVLLDEPSNHLDKASRALLYDFIQSSNATMIIVSHDRKLLNLLTYTCELGASAIKRYGGNYDFYKCQKKIENEALKQDIQSKEKALKKARQKDRETNERQQKLDARGKKKQVQAGMGKSMMNKMKNDAENSSAKLKNVHVEKIEGLSHDLSSLRSHLPEIDKIKFGLDDSTLHQGKILFALDHLNFAYKKKMLWAEPFNLKITSGERIVLSGLNGSGKTTLIKLLLGTLNPTNGTIHRTTMQSVYIDQDYSLLNPEFTVYQQAEKFDQTAQKEHEIKTRLNRFLFPQNDWDKPIAALSGGERMRLLLCCLTLYSQAPDCIILDEPTNNLDIQNVEILTAALNQYQGTLIVVSHDEAFLEEIGVNRTIPLEKN